MKKLYFLLFTLLIASTSFGQTTVFQESFEMGNSGTASVTCNDSFGDFFTVTDGTDIGDGGSFYSVAGSDGSYYFAAMDLDAAECNTGATSATETLDFTGIDINGFSNLTFAVIVAEDDDGATNQDWDESDNLIIEAQIDGGGYSPIMAFESTGASNTEPALDTDFDGTGDGTLLTASFQEFTASITSGTTLDLRFTFTLNSGDEDVAIDNIRVIDGYSASPTITTSTGVSGLNYVTGSGPSNEGSFTVEGTDLTDDILVTAPADFEISETSGGTFTPTITLAEGGTGAIAETTIYVRLKEMLAVNSYSGDVNATSTGASTKTVSVSGDVFNPATNALMIKGVFDNATGSTPKGIELEVLADIADLSIFGVGSANNGGGSDGEEFTFPAVSATAGDAIFVVNNGQIADFNAFFGLSIVEYESSAMSINGDDAIELFEGGQVIDVFGTIDCDPNDSGSACPEWEHTDGWAYRNTAGPSTSFVYTEWDYSGVGNLDGATNGGSTEPYPGATLGLDELETNSFNIYPNPTNTGFVNITSTSNDLLEAKVFDILGKQVLESTVTNNQLNVSNLNAGVYILKLTQNNASTTKKLVIK